MALLVRDALVNGALYLAYQPIVDVRTGAIYGQEGLVRSHAAELPAPRDIIPAAVEQNFMGSLGRALRAMAVRDCPGTNLFLNIHPDEFNEGWLVRPDDPIFAHDELVYMEITESVPLSHYRFCHSVLRELRSRGAKLAVDDLGAGYSNLKYIADLEPEIVKLDRELVAGLRIGSRQHTLVRSIVSMCEAQEARVVAEGIETADELRAVIDAGVHYVQGFFLARPAFPAPRSEWDPRRF